MTSSILNNKDYFANLPDLSMMIGWCHHGFTASYWHFEGWNLSVWEVPVVFWMVKNHMLFVMNETNWISVSSPHVCWLNCPPFGHRSPIKKCSLMKPMNIYHFEWSCVFLINPVLQNICLVDRHSSNGCVFILFVDVISNDHYPLVN